MILQCKYSLPDLIWFTLQFSLFFLVCLSFSYYENVFLTLIMFLQNACVKNLCSLHGKCEMDPKDNTYYCKSEHGFAGKYCDKGIF